MTATRDADRSERELALQLQTVRAAGPRRRWPLVVAGLVAGVLVAMVVDALVDGGDGDESATAGEDLLAVAEVTTADLVSFTDYDGVLGFGEPTPVTAPADGVVTRVPALDTVLVRGEVLVEIDGNPVVVFYGDLPLYRDIGPDVGDGDDVLLVEQNLEVLGFDADGTMLVDGYYDAATEQAVVDWQESVGREPDGVLDRGAVVVVEGPVEVTTAPVVGSAARAGTVLVELTVRTTTGTVGVPPPDPPAEDDEAAADGTPPAVVPRASVGAVDSLPAVGTPVPDGSELFRVGGRPVVALVAPGPVGRALVADDDEAVTRELELAGIADLATWAGGRGIGADVTDAWFVEVPASSSVLELLVEEGTGLAAGDPVVVVGATTQRVELDLSVEDLDELDVGDEVTVELPDGATVAGVVASRGTVAEVTPRPGQQDPVTTVDVTIELTAEPDSDVTEGPVTVRVVDEEIPGATVVPVRSLVSLAEGGFAVEVVDAGGAGRLVAVELGSFSDGLVEVVSGDVAPGDTLVVPK